ncbi:MAG: hypothetical protein B7Y40_07330 [Gammaproteobacteria bacterium 28-57-27]|nr:MAG: hypothetical protein B7Y40_07330 [Gammaproteobacteria bacterium 28-57-27]
MAVIHEAIGGWFYGESVRALTIVRFIGLTQNAVFTPSPLMGEGWGEGGEAGKSLCFSECFSPLSPTLSHEGGGG